MLLTWPEINISMALIQERAKSKGMKAKHSETDTDANLSHAVVRSMFKGYLRFHSISLIVKWGQEAELL